jgi:hypothetical protein
MNAGDLFIRMGVIVDKIKKLDRENPTSPGEETDPRIVRLLEEGKRIKEQLDPLVRERMRGDPAALAEWDEIMRMCDDLKEEVPKDSGPSRAD